MFLLGPPKSSTSVIPVPPKSSTCDISCAGLAGGASGAFISGRGVGVGTSALFALAISSAVLKSWS